MGVKEASNSGYAGEAPVHDSFQNLGECLNENNNSEGGGGVVGGLAGLVKDNAIGPFQGGGWNAYEPKESRLTMKSGAVLVLCFQIVLGIMSGPGANDGDAHPSALSTSRGVRRAGSFKGRRIVLAAPCGSPGKTWLRRALFSSRGVVAPGNSGKHGGGRPIANLLAVYRDCVVAVARNELQ